MQGDLSRLTFDPWSDYVGVGMQQGRVLLDSDWNEQAKIVDRRIRASTADLVERASKAHRGVVSQLTPQAFEIGLVDGNPRDLVIGSGRMYVDGMLVENHGRTDDRTFDPVLAELNGAAGQRYREQPYWPQDPLPVGSGHHLVYLDVWQRELTHIESPDLVEPALGIDTTTRTQTVWQVKVLPEVGQGVTSATPDAGIPGWSAATAPSAGRLTTAPAVHIAQDSPCEFRPAVGYRGLENQLYRVEIHDGGTLGQATFKWSRDNGSVASAVLAVTQSGSGARLADLGKDDYSRIKVGDWVEVLDDVRELSQRPGDLRRVVAVDQQAEAITFASPLTSDLTEGLSAGNRHLRVRRWDQAGKVQAKRRSGDNSLDIELVDLDDDASDGLITVPVDPRTVVELEAGVTISFDIDPLAANGAFHPGDHWIFYARAGHPDVEKLVKEPPRGIHHHFARLAIISFPSKVLDCRLLWSEPRSPGDCSTVEVTPDSHRSGRFTIQQAVDRVMALDSSAEIQGGTVLLDVGEYDLGESSVKIEGTEGGPVRSLCIRGQGPQTVIISSDIAVLANHAQSIVVENLKIVSTGQSSAAILFRNCGECRLSENIVQASGDAIVVSSGGAHVSDNSVIGPPGSGLGKNGVVLEQAANGSACQISGNRISGMAESGIFVRNLSAPLTVERNTITGCLNGIVIQSSGAREAVVSVVGNQISRITRRDPADLEIVGISLKDAKCVTVLDNSVTGVAEDINVSDNVTCVGISMDLCTTGVVARNFLDSIGPKNFTAANVFGIKTRGISGGSGRMDVNGNSIIRRLVGPDTPGVAWLGMVVEKVGTLVAQGNIIEARSKAQLILVSDVNSAMLATNQCTQGNAAGSEVPVVEITADSMCIQGNIIHGKGKVGGSSASAASAASIKLNVTDSRRYTALGNITEAKDRIWVQAGSGTPGLLDAPWKSLNTPSL